MSKDSSRGLGSALVIALLLSCGPPAGEGPSGSRSLLEEIQDRGVLRVGAECVYKGTCFLDPASGERVGYSVEITRLMAQDLGVEVEWVDLEWTALIPAIGTGQVDIITQGVTNSPERAKVVEMSKPMDYYPGVLVLPAGSRLHELETVDEVFAALNRPERSVAFLLGGAQERISKTVLPRAQQKGLDLAAAYLEVASGRADAMLADAGDAWDMIRANPGGKIWRDTVVYTLYGSMVIRPGEQRFLNWINNWIGYYTANQTLRSLKLKWFIERGVPEWMRVLPPAGF
jgi:ABC-type amino acid transport substrate-binding protein